MAFTIEKAARTGFCIGVKRALEIVRKVAKEQGLVETLGAIVHNEQVMQTLAEIGVKVVENVEDIKGDAVVTSSHGVSPVVEKAISSRNINIISTICGSVRRAQMAAKQLSQAGFYVVVYGDANHPEVKGILGWVQGKAMATLDPKAVAALEPMPRKLGILCQTTQVPDQFTEFCKRVIDSNLLKDSEIHIIDTVCHDIRERQEATIKLAKRVDLMLVVGGCSSANTNRLAELASRLTETHLIETAEDIQPVWLQRKKLVGIAAGASTAEETIEEVIGRLQSLNIK
jgi:4-hydroxy-3-methylbut-2-en-1-yl diphosphate reductase